ncbi:MAG: MobQ family relaxase [Bacillota bacterium]
MAIYHYSTQVASRPAGKSAVAMAAYRSGDRLEDERTGELKFYRRSTPPETIILAPANAPEWVQDRNRLWNEVEKAEKRKDAQLCREINVALPRELNADDQHELLLNYCQEQFADRGMVADVAIHRDNPENPHAHIMLTMRHIGPDGFGQKNWEWNPSFAFGKVQNAEKYIDWRAAWADHTNRALERAGETDRIDHRSFADQGIDRQSA